jgi:hypothetical protein
MKLRESFRVKKNSRCSYVASTGAFLGQNQVLKNESTPGSFNVKSTIPRENPLAKL